MSERQAASLVVSADNQGNPTVECPDCRTRQRVYIVEHVETEEAYLSGHDHNGKRCTGSQRAVPGFFL